MHRTTGLELSFPDWSDPFSPPGERVGPGGGTERPSGARGPTKPECPDHAGILKTKHLRPQV
jgi:hypothetical protein